MALPTIIALSGKRGAGKSTAAQFIRQSAGQVWEPLRFAGILKRFIADWLDIEVHELDDQQVKARYIESLNMTVGELLQRVGGGLREIVHEDFWVIGTMNRVLPGRSYLCEDCRYPNEVAAIEKAGGQVIRLVGDPLKQQGDGTRDDSHSSETALDGVELPTIYNTSSRHALRARLVDALRHLKKHGHLSVEQAKKTMGFKKPQ